MDRNKDMKRENKGKKRKKVFTFGSQWLNI
jgi:hypothetical protein